MNPEQKSQRSGNGDSGDVPEPSALDWVQRGDRLPRFLQTFETRLHRQRRRRWQSAIAGGAALITAGFLWQVTRNPAAPPGAAVASAIVTQAARQTLRDGSVVELKEGANFVAEYTAESRRVVLRHGVAHFQVAKDPNPFVVVAGELEVRAVGTAFSVHLDDKGLEVLVTEGQVAVLQPDAETSQSHAETRRRGGAETLLQSNAKTLTASPASPAGPPTFVNAGNRLVVNLEEAVIAPQLLPMTANEILERLAWRVPRLEFNGSPLAEAVATINRYSRVQLRLVGTEAGKVELSGVLRADNIEPLLTMLEGHYGLSVVRSGEVVLLSVSDPLER